jgi:hypothetical protein
MQWPSVEEKEHRFATTSSFSNLLNLIVFGFAESAKAKRSLTGTGI